MANNQKLLNAAWDALAFFQTGDSAEDRAMAKALKEGIEDADPTTTCRACAERAEEEDTWVRHYERLHRVPPHCRKTICGTAVPKNVMRWECGDAAARAEGSWVVR